MILKYYHRCSWCQRILSEGPKPIKTFIMCHACKDDTQTRREYSELTGATSAITNETSWDFVDYSPRPADYDTEDYSLLL